MENSFNMCNLCNIPKAMKYPREGQTWKPFMSCPNYKQHPPKITDGTSKPQNSPTTNEEAKGWQILGDELGAVNKRLDALAEYLKSKLG